MVTRQQSYFEGQKDSKDKIIEHGIRLRTEKDCSAAYNNVALHPWVNHVTVYNVDVPVRTQCSLGLNEPSKEMRVIPLFYSV